MPLATSSPRILNDLEFGLERAGEIRHRVFAARLHLLHRRLVDIGGEARRVDVDIAAAGLHQALDDLALDPHHVVDEIVEAFVDALRVLVVEALRDAIRPDQRDLGRGLRDLGDEFIFLERHVAAEPQPLLGGPAMRDRRAGVVHLLDFPALARLRALDAPLIALDRGTVGVEALDRRAEAVLEVQAADLAVGDDVEPDALLEPHAAAHRLVLALAHLRGAQFALVEADALFPQSRRPQQAADDVRPDCLEIGHSWFPVMMMAGTLLRRTKPAQARGPAAWRMARPRFGG